MLGASGNISFSSGTKGPLGPDSKLVVRIGYSLFIAGFICQLKLGATASELDRTWRGPKDLPEGNA